MGSRSAARTRAGMKIAGGRGCSQGSCFVSGHETTGYGGRKFKTNESEGTESRIRPVVSKLGYRVGYEAKNKTEQIKRLQMTAR